MKLAVGITALSALLACAPSSAQQLLDRPPLDPRDKVVSPDTPGPAGDWEENAWWVALAECAAMFRSAPEDREKVQTFGTAAMGRLAKDRGLQAREAAAIVIPYINGPKAREIAEVFIALYGGVEMPRQRCDRVLEQHGAI